MYALQDKTADLVATIGGNWTPRVCNGFCGLLVKAERQKTNKASNAKPGPKATKKAPNKVKAKQRKAKVPKPMAKKERQQLERVLPRVDEVLASFRTAQVPVELVRGGSL